MVEIFVILNLKDSGREVMLNANLIEYAKDVRGHTEVSYPRCTYRVRQSPSEILALIRKEEKRQCE